MFLRIETKRLVLTPEEEKDAAWLTELLNARGTGTFTTEEARERIAAMTATIEAIGIGALVLRTRSDGDALGYSAIVIGRCSIDEPEQPMNSCPGKGAGIRHRSVPRAAGGRLRNRAPAHLVDCAVVESAIIPSARETRVPSRLQHDGRWWRVVLARV